MPYGWRWFIENARELEDVMSGELEVNQLKKVEVEDLLGRDPVELDMDMISNELTNKTILVSGRLDRIRNL